MTLVPGKLYRPRSLQHFYTGRSVLDRHPIVALTRQDIVMFVRQEEKVERHGDHGIIWAYFLWKDTALWNGYPIISEDTVQRIAVLDAYTGLDDAFVGPLSS